MQNTATVQRHYLLDFQQHFKERLLSDIVPRCNRYRIKCGMTTCFWGADMLTPRQDDRFLRYCYHQHSKNKPSFRTWCGICLVFSSILKRSSRLTSCQDATDTASSAVWRFAFEVRTCWFLNKTIGFWNTAITNTPKINRHTAPRCGIYLVLAAF